MYGGLPCVGRYTGISATDSDEGMSVPHVVDHYTGKEDILRLIRRNLVEQPYRNDLE